jgi:hypothetical protein
VPKRRAQGLVQASSVVERAIVPHGAIVFNLTSFAAIPMKHAA